MSTYSIKDLENLSGIKAHTLRIWEQRYGILNPKRTATNIRFYDSSDLKLVLNIARLREEGQKISRIAAMTREGMQQQVMALTDKDPQDYQNHIHNLLTAMIDLDEALFEKSLSTCILQLGFETTMLQVIYPFLVKIGYLWQADAIHPAQEHFITCLIRQKIIVAIDGQKLVGTNDSRKFMLFLPENELHEINLLFVHFLLKKHGTRVIYLGQSLPMHDLKMAFDLHKPHYLVTSITSPPGKKYFQEYLRRLGRKFPETEILVGGSALNMDIHKIPENIVPIRSLEQLYPYCQFQDQAV